MPNSILDLYNKWVRVDAAGNKTPIRKPAQFNIGTENTAANQVVDFLSTEKSLIGKNVIKGFTPMAKKGATEYPILDNKTMEVVRVLETQGTHVVPRLSNTNKYSDITPRQ